MKLHNQSADGGRRSPNAYRASGEPSDRPSGHRKRCHTACTHCRTLRVKCSGTSPCTNCVSSGRHCDYENSSRRVSHPQGEIGGRSAEPEQAYQQSPEVDMTVPDDKPAATAQREMLRTPDSTLLPSFRDVECLPSSPSAGPQATDIPAVEGTTLAADVSQQQHIIDHAEPYQDQSMFLDLDVLPWSLLHENLYLPMEFDLSSNCSLLGPPPAAETHAAAAEQIPPQGMTIESHTAASSIDRRADINASNLFNESTQTVPQTGISPPTRITVLLSQPLTEYRFFKQCYIGGSICTPCCSKSDLLWTRLFGGVKSNDCIAMSLVVLDQRVQPGRGGFSNRLC